VNGVDWLAALDSHIDLVSVLWLLPIVFMFHDFEEILTVEKWLAGRGEYVLGKMPPFLKRLFADSFRMNTLLFARDVLWIYTFIVAAAAAAAFFQFYMPFLVILAIFFLHVFTHAAQAIVLRMYTPGVATAWLLVLPYSLYAYYRLLGSGTIGRDDIVLSLVLMTLLLPVGLWLLVRDRRLAVRRL
jgi:hypothetical protein